MFRAETLDHVAFPVRDLPRSEKFYLDTVGLTFLTQRKNADGSPRHTYVQAG
jgi:catechol 2,3-dioxygenase-like lactoylglutathione lyase family enzyme